MGIRRGISAVLALLFLALLPACAPVPKGTEDLGAPAQWVDSAMEQAVRQELGKPTGTVYTGELDHLRIVAVRSSSVQFNNSNIYRYDAEHGVQALDDLVNFRKLGGLQVSQTPIADCSAIALCQELQYLHLFENPNLSDITP